ncbi:MULTISPECIES: hypothetical protein [Vibrio]|uniref:hypothetical protein n=1 Tax=Vibrio TaxID=662 RepID=UPI00100EB7F7|nr:MULTISPECIES: hypothetical protein [Vibrio]MCR9545375.1 hypothetical protein [Vibrio antiquarius]MDF5409688.1 hypothetical protein [Vibrio parahaemolyticus]MDG2825185.1 hypothetical protein [Vibrio parahaemolyticus]MDG2844931.1 hypothetical protein [Vibrio parahaemolyticus]MDG2860887.1 hypothetical protein [Vibrio parahaemolyticus]
MKLLIAYIFGVLTPVFGYCLYVLAIHLGHIEHFLEVLTTLFTFVLMLCAIFALTTWRKQITEQATYDAALEYESQLIKFLVTTVREKRQEGNNELMNINERIKYCQFLMKCREFLPSLINEISVEFGKAANELDQNGYVSECTHDSLLDKQNQFSKRINKHFHIKSKA